MMLILFKRCGLMASAHHAVSGELSMRDERRPGLDGPGRMVKSREFGPTKFSYHRFLLKRSIEDDEIQGPSKQL